jgi:serine/threonine-protein kinase
MTPAAKASRWVRIEVDLAQELGRPILPLLAAGERRESVLLSLRDVQHLDMRADYRSRVQAQLLPALHDLLGTAAIGHPAQAPTIFSSPPLAIEWVTVPASEFLMGSDKSQDARAFDNEMPQHKLHLPEYHIAQYPITNAQYLKFVEVSNHAVPHHWTDGKIPSGLENHPVVNVSWQDACAYCDWASRAAGCKIRLPSEAEWEKAARGTDGRIWPWGNELRPNDVDNFAWDAAGTTPVDKYPQGKSPYGCYDMAGNVLEWTGSQYKPYPYVITDDRDEPEGARMRTLRGGAFSHDGGYDGAVRCAFRLWSLPDLRSVFVGFRVVSPAVEALDL